MRISMIGLVLFALSLAFTQDVISQTNKKSNKRPNFIIILADDLGYGETGCYGQKIIRTPHIDKLASEGIRFTDFYAGSTVCAPSRCCLMTGMNTGHAQIRDNLEIGNWDDYLGQAPLEPNTYTIARMFKQAGYKTACIGKWGLGGPGSTGVPDQQGFDFFFGYLCQRHAHNHYPAYLWYNNEKFLTGNPDFSPQQKLSGNPKDPSNYKKYQGTSYAEELFTEEALHFIKSHKDSAFFLLMTYTLPHLALQVPDSYLQEYRDLMNDRPYTGQMSYLPVFYPHATYAAMVSALDDATGKILQALAENNLDSNTCVIFTSDNGATFSLGGADPQFFTSNGPFRGGKGSLYEGGIRVPCIARWPGKIMADQVCSVPYASWDIMPTLAQLAELGLPKHIDGISFAPALQGAKNPPQHEFLYWEYTSTGGNQAIRAGKWKLVRKDLIKEPMRRSELYDLSTDPGEKINVAEQHPEVIQMMKAYTRKRSPSSKPEWNFLHY
ncbi:MAG: arylsulfatase [Bacteroidetes bacterium]|nr:arylsulfatase [Bacteroidota bacterium]